MSMFAAWCVVILGFVSVWGSLVLEDTVVALAAWCGMVVVILGELVKMLLKGDW